MKILILCVCVDAVGCGGGETNGTSSNNTTIICIRQTEL